MLYILEGPDGSGKTTLLNKLQHIGFINIDCVKRFSTDERNMWESILSFVTYDIKHNYVMDRCFLSEWIYRVLKQEEKVCLSMQDIMYLLNKSKNIKFIYCKTKNAYSLAMTRGETYINKKEHIKLCKYYDFVFDTLKVFYKYNVVTYDWRKNKVEDVL